VARLCQRPQTVHPQHRVPRPDDPTPRKPPVIFIREKNSKRTESLGTIENDRSLKRVGSANLNGFGPPKRLKLLEAKNRAIDTNIFKIPELPEPKQGNVDNNKGKVKEKDVFGDVAEVVREPDIQGKQRFEQNQILAVTENTLEKANKNVSSSSRVSVVNGRDLSLSMTGCQKGGDRVFRQNQRSNGKLNRQRTRGFQRSVQCHLPRCRICTCTFWHICSKYLVLSRNDISAS
jgi:hypothetical protein